MENELVIYIVFEVIGKWEKIMLLFEVCNEYNCSVGGLYIIDNKMYILMQECMLDIYGKLVFIKELNNLDILIFKESFVDNIFLFFNNSDGVYIFNFFDNYIVYDIKKNVFSLLFFLKKVVYKFIVKYRIF